MALLIEMVMDRGMDGREFLEGLYVSQPGHRALTSSKWLVRVFSSIVEPPLANLIRRITDHIHRCPVGPKPVRDDRSRLTVTLDRALQKLERSLAIPPFRRENLEHFAFMINGTP